VLERGLPQNVCLNVNIPHLDSAFKGMKVTTGDMGRWVNEWEHRVDPKGRDYYWLTGDFEIADKDQGLTDYYWLQRGYVTVTPTHVDQTDFASMAAISDLLL
jgi:5'-nucleotidase